MTGGQKFLVFLVIIIFISGWLWFFDMFGIKTKLSGKINLKSLTGSLNMINVKDEMNKEEEFQPQNTLSWCQPQLVSIGKNEYEPQEVNIIGEDNVNQCCVYKYKGVNNCLNKTQEVDICLTSTIGGTIKYIKIEDKYKNTQYYQQFINNLDNVYNPTLYNKCLLEIY